MYEVGQIVYTVIENKHKVIPVKIVEQVVTKTLQGEKIQYTIELPNTKKQKLNLDKFDKVFVNIKEVQEHLMNNASIAIKKMIHESADLQERFFPLIESEFEEVLTDTIQQNKAEETIKVDLGNGQLGNIKISEANIPLTLNEVDQKKTWKYYYLMDTIFFTEQDIVEWIKENSLQYLIFLEV